QLPKTALLSPRDRLRVDQSEQAANDDAPRGDARQVMAAREAMPEIERQDGFPAGDDLAMVAGSQVPPQHARDEGRDLIGNAGRLLREEGNAAVPAPCEPGLEMQVLLPERVDEQPHRRAQVRRRDDICDG